MDAVEGGSLVVGGLVGAAVGYKLTEGQDTTNQILGVISGALAGAVIGKVGVDTAIDLNPLT